MGKTVLVTGSSTGIGLATARAFLREGWTVYATARDERDLRGLARRGAETATLDVTSETDVIAVVEGLVEAEGRLDCLVNNAGYGQLGPVEDVDTERVVRQFDANVFGPHRLFRAVLPHMRSRRAGRILNVSSAVGRFALPGVGVYASTKFALRAISDALRRELRGSGVRVVVVEPWVVASDFFEVAVAELQQLERSPRYDDLYRLLESVEGIDEDDFGVASPREVARTIVRAATVEEPNAYYRVGSLAGLGPVVGVLLDAGRFDAATRLSVELLSKGDSWRSR